MDHICPKKNHPRPNITELCWSSILVIAIGTGCGIADRIRSEPTGENRPGNVTGTDSPSPGTSGTKVPHASIPNGSCENEYYLVDPRLTRDYEITGSGPGKYTLTQKNVSANGFEEVRDFESGVSVTNNWVCTDEGLRTAEFTNTGVMPQGRFEMETVSSSGITVPRNPRPGDSFDSAYDVRVKVRAGPVAADATGKVKIADKVISVGESIEVRGRSFEATRIDSIIEIEINLRGRKVEGANVNVSNWYGKGAGLIKQETGGTFDKQFVELVSIGQQ